MRSILERAGLLAVEEDNGTVYARLPTSCAEVQVLAAGPLWMLTLSRPLRAKPEDLVAWQETHPGTRVDLLEGETRLIQWVKGDVPALRESVEVAEAFVTASLRWRRGQRAVGEGF